MEKLWSTADVSDFLGIPVGTLYQWRHRGYGPKGTRVGRHIRFRPDDVMEWFDSLDAA